jgi:pyridoxal phosphate enzyme (YggS family)
MSTLEDRYREISQIVSKYTGAKLLAVSKYTSDENIQTIYDLGHRDFGENRVPELLERAQRFPKDIRWHFIGNLQSNKISKLLQLENLVAIHSVDRISLLEKIIKNETDNQIDLYLQVNTSGESAKSGLENTEEVIRAVTVFSRSNHYSFLLKGLMSMAAIRTEDYLADAKISFEKLIEIRRQVHTEFPELDLELNMGMSRDFQLALDLGSQLIRVGSTLFNPVTSS